jgi:muramoyltetrapeptide carboxypeptidase LdcA involved in peptidoglycan recycling
LCWFSDITAIANAITHITWVVTYSWPHFSTWAMQKWFEYNLEYFKKCLIKNEPYKILHSDNWSDDLWFLDQENRDFIQDNNYWIINKWNASWKLVWWHVRCLSCLQWTKYMPSLENSILFLEEDEETNWSLFDRLIQSLIHQKDFSQVRWIVIWRFQKNSKITKENLIGIIKSKKELNNMPIIANADLWHTNPLITFPIWWTVNLEVENNVNIEIVIH